VTPEEAVWEIDLGGRGCYRLSAVEGRVVGWFGAGGEPGAELGAVLHRSPHYREDRVADCSEVKVTVDGREASTSAEWLFSQVAGSSARLSGRLAEHDVTVASEYQLDLGAGWVRRRCHLVNEGTAPVRVNSAPSARIALLPGHWSVTSLYGQHCDEARVQRTVVPVGQLRFATTHGRSGLEAVPWCTLERSEDGHALCVALAWSGNWTIELSGDVGGAVTVSAGWLLPPEGLSLGPGEPISTPWAYIGSGLDGADALGRELTALEPSVARPRLEVLPVQFNSWYPLPGKVNVGRLAKFVDVAAGLGCETFVLDAGWYTNRGAPPEADWGAQLGDWVVSSESFPRGAAELRERVRKAGMKFGVWVEPEVASATSDVYRQHRDWFHSRDGHVIERGPRRVIHLGIPEAAAHVRRAVLAVIEEWDADWLKWDFNTNLYDGDDRPEWGGLVGHVLGLYETWDWLRGQKPGLVLENCASGGGRLDMAAGLKSDVTWMSDMVSPLNALSIRFGASRVFTPRYLNNWLVQWPPGHLPNPAMDISSPDPDAIPDLLFRAHVAMMGTFGISAPVDLWSTEDIELVADQVALYRSLSDVVQNGACHRFTADPVRGPNWDWASMGFYHPGRKTAVVFAFRLLATTDSLEVTLPADWRTASAQVLAGKAGVRLEGAKLAIEVPERMRSCLIELA
jgi:alpha-galactosidase